MLDAAGEFPCIGPAQYGGWWAKAIRQRGPGRGRERGLEEGLVVRVAEEALAEQAAWRRGVEADELESAP